MNAEKEGARRLAGQPRADTSHGHSTTHHGTVNADELRRKKPLFELMADCGDGAAVKKSAHCIFHEDKSKSFSAFEKDNRWFWKCHAGCGAGDEVDYLKKKFGLDDAGAFDKWRKLAGLNGLTPVSKLNTPTKSTSTTAKPAPSADVIETEWRAAVEAFTDNHVKEFAQWRGLSLDFVTWLKSDGIVGQFQKNLAFVVRGDTGTTTGIHCRVPPVTDGERARFFYRLAAGTSTAPLMFGDPKTADIVFVFESQFDAFAGMDKLNWHKRPLPNAAVIVTRGAANAGKTFGLKHGAAVYAFGQNDPAGVKWLADLVTTATADGATVRPVKTPDAHKDVNDWTRSGATGADLNAAMDVSEVIEPPKPTLSTTSVPAIQFFSPSELRAYRPPDGHVRVGDCHIVRGIVTVIGGAPGVGKSRAAVALSVAGATSKDWFGLKVHTKFKTMVIQNENGRFRLSREFADMDCPALEDFVRVSEPPPFGLAFDNGEFTAKLIAELDAFKPDVVVLDPWNAVACDEKAKDYLETFKLIRSVLPVGDAAPALVIVAHTRKPKADERATGRGLLNLLAGSYVLGSVPRCAFVLQAASDDPEDDCVVWTCCKNNDGELGGRSAWHRENGLFTPATDFDWETFDAPAGDRPTVKVTDVAAVLDNGRLLRKAELVKALEDRTSAGKSCCYAALKKFDAHLEDVDGLWRWKA